MVSQARRISLAQWIVLIAAVCVAFSAHGFLDKQIKAANDAKKPTQVLPDPSIVKLWSMGYDRVLSDIYWLGLIQYVGEVSNDKDRYRQAGEYVNLITTMDPKFENAYWFGCWAIGYWQQDPAYADKMIQRGISNFPHSWYMRFIGGVNQYLFAHNTKAAAHYYQEAAEQPGCPQFVKRQAMILASPIPELEKRWRSLYDLAANAKDPDVKQSAFEECIVTLKKIYKEAPTEMMRASAKAQLLKLGVKQDEL